MRNTFYKALVFAAFTLLLAHNSIPHHHHYGEPVSSGHAHDDEHNHGHSALAFLHIDEVFVQQDAALKTLNHPSPVFPVLFWKNPIEEPAIRTVHTRPATLLLPPLLPDRWPCHSLRGPPVA